MKKFDLPEQKEIINYLNGINYVGFIKQNGNVTVECFDQKTTFDILNCVCKCIIDNIKRKGIKWEFTYIDFFKDDYSKKIFEERKKAYGAAYEINNKTKKEFDKVFTNSFKTLCYTNILKVRKSCRRNYYSINNYKIVKLCADSIDACITFICINAYKFLFSTNSDNLISSWNNLIDSLANNTFIRNKVKKFKEEFISYMETVRPHRNKNLKGNGTGDITQIFQKLINPLFYIYDLPKYNSNNIQRYNKVLQTTNDMMYFRLHKRDFKRIFGLTRKENKTLQNRREPNIWSSEDQAKTVVKQCNQKYWNLQNDNYKSELEPKYVNVNAATIAIHHIKPKNEFDVNHNPHLIENLILLDKNEHGNAHLNGNTKLINFKNLQNILYSQFHKIINYAERNINEYDLYKFYELLCYMFGLTINKIYSSSKEMLIGYINNIIELCPNVIK